jgi:CoA binding domain
VSYRDPAAIKRALLSRNWAVVGLTRHEYRAAHTVAAFLQANGIRIVPVNPLAESVLGENGYAHLSALRSMSETSSVALTRPGSTSTRRSRSARGASGSSLASSMSRQPNARSMTASTSSWTHAPKSRGPATARAAADTLPQTNQILSNSGEGTPWYLTAQPAS